MNVFADTNLRKMIKIDERKKGESISTVGLIQFESGDIAEQAVALTDKKVNGQTVKIGYARSPIRRPTGPKFSRTRLHVSGIGKLSEDELSKMLGKCSLIYPKRSDPENAYLFAEYENEEEKQAAMDNLNGKKVDEENVLKLSPAYAQRPRGPRRRVSGE